MSFVVRGELNQSSWELAVDEAAAIAPGFSAAGAVTAAGEAAAGGGGLRLWREVNAAFPVSLDDMVSGPEDPRVLRLDDGATLVLVAAWEATKVQWQHAIEISEAEVPEGGGGGAPVATRLEVDLRYAQLLALGLGLGLLRPSPHIHTRALSRPLTRSPNPPTTGTHSCSACGWHSSGRRASCAAVRRTGAPSAGGVACTSSTRCSPASCSRSTAAPASAAPYCRSPRRLACRRGSTSSAPPRAGRRRCCHMLKVSLGSATAHHTGLLQAVSNRSGLLSMAGREPPSHSARSQRLSALKPPIASCSFIA